MWVSVHLDAAIKRKGLRKKVHKAAGDITVYIGNLLVEVWKIYDFLVKIGVDGHLLIPNGKGGYEVLDIVPGPLSWASSR